MGLADFLRHGLPGWLPAFLSDPGQAAAIGIDQPESLPGGRNDNLLAGGDQLRLSVQPHELPHDGNILVQRKADRMHPVLDGVAFP